MITITLGLGESLRLGPDVTVTVLAVRDQEVRLGIGPAGNFARKAEALVLDSHNFRPVPDWPGYRVNPLGTVQSCRTNGGKLGPQWKAKVLRRDRDGYLKCRLHRRGEEYFVGAHTLVLLAFVGPRPEGMEGCHNDGDPGNNRLDNLRWDTPRGNQADRDRHGRTATGERNGRAKLTAGEVALARKLRARGLSLRRIGRLLGINKSQVGKIVSVTNWKTVAAVPNEVWDAVVQACREKEAKERIRAKAAAESVPAPVEAPTSTPDAPGKAGRPPEGA